MTDLHENARAKLNLTLRILGRRGDGYHEIESLVAFARVGDRLTLAPGERFSLYLAGPFVAPLRNQSNLIETAALQFKHAFPDAHTGHFTLEKRLPVAAGIGGGSADAAAALRLLAKANSDCASEKDLQSIAREVGSDVPACVTSRPVMMRGRGTDLYSVTGLPVLNAILVNPGIALGTQEVYGALEAPSVGDDSGTMAEQKKLFSTTRELADYISAIGNDLEAPAMKLVPKLGDVLAELRQLDDCLAAQMSGSGATCFAIFESPGSAASAVRKISISHPNWWVAATQLNLKSTV
jgi:4-diphosphocytidyl-2-C-methyl-D-erythritol kinase